MRTKRIFQLPLALFLGLSLVWLSSCNKDEEVKLSTINATVLTSSTYSSIPVTGVYVKILNTSDNTTDSVMVDADGVATFTDLATGTYNLSASLELTAAQVMEATGYNAEITLNAVKDGVEPLPGTTVDVTLTLDGKPAGSLLIKQFYYGAGNVPTLPLLMSKDQFVEIYNNSDEVIYADGLYIAALSPRGAGEASDVASEIDRTEFIYSEEVFKLPGSGQEYPIQPGESIVVANNGVDFTEGGTYTGTVDNSGADFEIFESEYITAQGGTPVSLFDAPDNPDIPNVEMKYFWQNAGWFYYRQEGASIAIFRSDTELTETVVDPIIEAYPYLKIPVSAVIDAADFLFNADAVAFKRLPTSLDASFNYVEGGSRNSGKSLERKVAKTVGGRQVLMDTNNSANDFEVVVAHH
jgi:hypothetical protein